MDGIQIYRSRRAYLFLLEGISVYEIGWKNIKRDPILKYLLDEIVIRLVCEFLCPDDPSSEYYCDILIKR